MYIYVSGPYSATNSGSNEEKQKQIESNIKEADKIAIELVKKGHFPFVPHTMMRDWENLTNRSLTLDICKKWVERCDAFYFIGPSEGAEIERKVAVEYHLPVYRSLNDIPEVTSVPPVSMLSSEAIKSYFTEYTQCMESYRHTYATIWQAGAIFAAISAGIITFAEKSNVDNSNSISPLILILAPLPLLFWWWGIFIPMNRYGEYRRNRLVDIEIILRHPSIRGLHMKHFTGFTSGTNENILKRICTLKWLWRPRVREVVTIFGFATLILELFFLVKWFTS